MSTVPPSAYYMPKGKEITDTNLWALEEFFKHRSYRRVLYFVGGAGVFFAAWYLYKRFSARSKHMIGAATSSPRVDEAGTNCDDEIRNNNTTNLQKVVTGPSTEDKVIIHCCPRGFFVPSIATEPLKLETFLRVAKIPYEVNFCNEFETPFLTYGDKTGNDFRECIRILSEKFDINLETKDVTSSRKTASHLVDISLENMFSWAILIWRWIYDEGKSMKKIHAMNALGEEVVPEVAQRVKDATKFQPIGQLDKAEFIKTIHQGIHDISAALGKHKYFQGQTPGIVDCHAFAILAQMMWNMPGSPFESQLRKYGNLVEFVQRMKEKYWADWNELILKPREFEENFAVGKYHRSASSSKSRKASKIREPEERTTVDKNSSHQQQNAGSDEETVSEKNIPSPTPPETKTTPVYAVAPAANKLPEPEPVSAIPKKEISVQESGPDSAAPSQPVGILKAGANTNATVAKPRSGLVTASFGSTKFPVDQVNQPSVSKLETDKMAPLPPQSHQHQQQFHTKQEDSMMHVHKTSVKFANVESDESTMIHQQGQVPQSPQPQNTINVNNGNYQPSTTSHNISSRAGHQYHGSHSDELSNKSTERQHSENQRQTNYVHQDQYNNYSQRQQMQSSNPVADDYHRAHVRTPLFHAPPNVPPTYAQQSSYPIPPQMFNNQTIPGGIQRNYPQQVHYVPPQISSPDSDGLQSPPPFSHHHALNPEQLQKAAQAHLDAYYQHHQRQQYQQQQQQQQQQQGQYNNNYHTSAGIVPSFVAPPFDPRNPQALLRF